MTLLLIQRHVQTLKCLILELWVEFVSVSEKGQPLYKGQRARSQFVRYSEVLLYYTCYYSGDAYPRRVCGHTQARQWNVNSYYIM